MTCHMGPHTSLWLQQQLQQQQQQQQGSLQPALLLPPSCSAQDTQLLILQSLQQQQQQQQRVVVDMQSSTGLQASSAYPALQQQQQQQQVAFVGQGTTCMQPQQQQLVVFVTQSGEQVVLMNAGPIFPDQQQQQQQQLHANLQPLQQQQQQILFPAAEIQPSLIVNTVQGSSSNKMGHFEGPAMLPMSSPHTNTPGSDCTALPMHLGSTSSLVNSSSGSPACTLTPDTFSSSSSSSWQCIDTTSAHSNTSSPSFRQYGGAAGGGTVVLPASQAAVQGASGTGGTAGNGPSMLRIVSGPERPQPMEGPLYCPQEMQYTAVQQAVQPGGSTMQVQLLDSGNYSNVSGGVVVVDENYHNSFVDLTSNTSSNNSSSNSTGCFMQALPYEQYCNTQFGGSSSGTAVPQQYNVPIGYTAGTHSNQIIVLGGPTYSNAITNSSSSSDTQRAPQVTQFLPAGFSLGPQGQAGLTQCLPGPGYSLAHPVTARPFGPALTQPFGPVLSQRPGPGGRVYGPRRALGAQMRGGFSPQGVQQGGMMGTRGCAPRQGMGSAAAAGAQSSAAAAAAAAAGAAGSSDRADTGPYGQVPLQECLQQLWSSEQLLSAKGGRLFNVQQLAWLPIGAGYPNPQELYDFAKLKRMVQKLDAVHKTRVKLIKRLHAVADYGGCDLGSVYREVRCLIGELLHDAAMHIKSFEECRVAGLVRFALTLQDALRLGPKAEGEGAEGEQQELSGAACDADVPSAAAADVAAAAKGVALEGGEVLGVGEGEGTAGSAAVPAK